MNPLTPSSDCGPATGGGSSVDEGVTAGAAESWGAFSIGERLREPGRLRTTGGGAPGKDSPALVHEALLSSQRGFFTTRALNRHR